MRKGYNDFGAVSDRISPNYMDRSRRYQGYPVESGAGIVNTPGYEDEENPRNKLLAQHLAREQLRFQGFDILDSEEVVEPTFDEIIDYREPQTNIEIWFNPDTGQYEERAIAPSSLTPMDIQNQPQKWLPYQNQVAPEYVQYRNGTYQDNYYSESNDMFPPMPGYHMSYVAGMGFYVPEMLGYDDMMTNMLWNSIDPEVKKAVYMRYFVVDISYLGLLPVVGSILKRGFALYAMKPNLAFANQLQTEACKNPLPWYKKIKDDFTGYGNALGQVKIGGHYEMIIQGLETLEFETKEMSYEQSSIGQMGSIGQEVAKQISEVIDNAFKTMQSAGKQKRRASKKAKKRGWF